MQFDSRMLNPFDDLEPLRPVRVDQKVESVYLDEKGSMTDPGDADFIRLEIRK